MQIRIPKNESKQSEIACKQSEPARSISKIQKRREFVKALCYEQCPKNSFKRLYIVKGLLVLVEKALISKEFRWEFQCGGEVNNPVPRHSSLSFFLASQVESPYDFFPFLFGCNFGHIAVLGIAKIYRFPPKQVMASCSWPWPGRCPTTVVGEISKCRGDLDLGLCTTLGLAFGEQQRNSIIWFFLRPNTFFSGSRHCIYQERTQVVRINKETQKRLARKRSRNGPWTHEFCKWMYSYVGIGCRDCDYL